MIIQKINITTFAGLTGRKLQFKDKLNVVLGPNEAGKSTIFSTIENIMFTPAKLTPSKFDKTMGDFLPIGGGDTLKAEIDFTHDGEKYQLQRTWGSASSAVLTLPGGGIIGDDEKIQEEIEKCLQVSEGTCRNVLMTYQSGLTRTLEKLQNDTETMQSFGDLMRTVVMELDGVSVDAFKAQVEEAYHSCNKRWDDDARYPDNGRGVNNPYRKDFGTIVKTYYDMENLRKCLEDAENFENDMDEINTSITQCVKELDEKNAYLKKYKKARDDAASRSKIEAEIRSLKLETEKLAEINQNWPVLQQKIKDDTASLPVLEKQAEKLNKEKELNEKAEGSRELVSRFQRAKLRKDELAGAEKKLKAAAVLTDSTLKKIREASATINSLESSLSAGKLYLKFTAEKDMGLTVQEGFSKEKTQKLKKEQTVKFNAAGSLKLAHKDWSFEAASGEGNYDALILEHENAEKTFEKLLKQSKIASLEKAETLNTAYNKALQDATVAKSNLEVELSGDTYEKLEKSVKDIKLPEKMRKTADVVENYLKIINKRDSLKKDRVEHKKTIEGYQEEYTDTTTLLLRLADLTADKKKKTETLSALEPLPVDEGENADDFIEKYENIEDEYHTGNERKNVLIQDKLQMEGDAPDNSVEEYTKELKEAEEAHAMELKKGRTIARIRKVMVDLLNEMDSNTYQGLEEDVEAYTARMTDDRYCSIEMDESLPSGLHRSDGEVITYERLSAGTRDVLSIALKLAMANKYLEDREGFIILDDPLVNLDPGRQKGAAEVIRSFAEGRQVILFTCHPAHAKLLGGNQVDLHSTTKKERKGK